MDLIEKKLSELKPYDNNPRKNGMAVDYVAESIKQFGFRVPIVIDNENTIVCGHTRYEAAKKLKLKTVPCVTTDDLTEQQIRAYRIADNKVSEFAEWDYDLLNYEIEQIEGFGDGSIEMTDFGFTLGFGDKKSTEEETEDEGYFGDERERTYDSVNLHDFDAYRCDGFYQMPILKKELYVPEKLIGFNYVMNTDAFDCGVHFFIDDYQFERIWNDPHKYMERLSKFDCVLTPDFSLYMDMPIAMQIWNIYRSRLIGQICQDYGLRVIPTLSWSSKDSYKFCFEGLEPGGVYAVSTVGVMKDEGAKEIWHDGMSQAEKILRPECIVLYGTENIDYKFTCKSVNIKTREFSK